MDERQLERFVDVVESGSLSSHFAASEHLTASPE